MVSGVRLSFLPRYSPVMVTPSFFPTPALGKGLTSAPFGESGLFNLLLVFRAALFFRQVSSLRDFLFMLRGQSDPFSSFLAFLPASLDPVFLLYTGPPTKDRFPELRSLS